MAVRCKHCDCEMPEDSLLFCVNYPTVEDGNFVGWTYEEICFQCLKEFNDALKDWRRID